MSSDRLHSILQALREELSSAGTLSAEDRALLGGVVTQIRDTIGEEGEVDTDDHSLIETLDNAALHFESEHPRLTDTLYQISELLRSAGLS